MNMSSPTSAATKLRRMIEDEKGILMCPGVYDGISARIALSVGFDCLYMVLLSPLLSPQSPSNV